MHKKNARERRSEGYKQEKEVAGSVYMGASDAILLITVRTASMG